MKVIKKQNNSKMCIICGMDNPLGVGAQFYSMEDKSVMSLFRFRQEHQSYPGRVHGGVIAAMLDELGLRACWSSGEDIWGVTLSMEVKYRKPVPYETRLIGRGTVEKATNRFVIARTEILDSHGAVLANAVVKYMKLNVSQIAENADIHEEMCYCIKDSISEINFK